MLLNYLSKLKLNVKLVDNFTLKWINNEFSHFKKEYIQYSIDLELFTQYKNYKKFFLDFKINLCIFLRRLISVF